MTLLRDKTHGFKLIPGTTKRLPSTNQLHERLRKLQEEKEQVELLLSYHMLPSEPRVVRTKHEIA